MHKTACTHAQLLSNDQTKPNSNNQVIMHDTETSLRKVPIYKNVLVKLRKCYKIINRKIDHKTKDDYNSHYKLAKEEASNKDHLMCLECI